MRPVRALIVEDERLARSRLQRLLKTRHDIEVVGVACDGDEAVAMVAELQPELLFLDIQMPGMSGFDVLGAVDEMPFVIFTTAFDQYALRAFEVHALDYLLKPFDRERLDASVDRAVTVIRGTRRVKREETREFLEQLAPLTRLVIRAPGRILFPRLDEIDWLEAAENYVYVHVGRDRHLLRGTLKSLEERLDPSRFVRVHRSAIVNRDQVREIIARAHGDCTIVLRNGSQLTASRTFAARLRPARP